MQNHLYLKLKCTILNLASLDCLVLFHRVVMIVDTKVLDVRFRSSNSPRNQAKFYTQLFTFLLLYLA